MDFLRTLKRRKPKKHITARVNVVPPKSHRAKPRRIRVKKLSATLNLASCLALFLGLAVTQGRADEYYIYKTAKGELVISNKQPPPGSTIIKQLPGETAPAQEPAKPQPNVKSEDSPKSTKDK